MFAIGGRNNKHGPLSSIEKYDSVSNDWTVVCELPCGIHGHQAVALPDSIYILGGSTGREQSSAMWKLDPSTFEITCLPSMNIPRSDFTSMVSHNCNFIYAIGGLNSQQGALNSVERFDLVLQQWSFVNPMKHPRHGHASSISLTKLK